MLFYLQNWLTLGGVVPSEPARPSPTPCQSIRKLKIKVMIIQLDVSYYHGLSGGVSCVLLQSRSVGWEDGGLKGHRKVRPPAWGHTAAAGVQVPCPELSVKTTSWDRGILGQETLHRAAGRPCPALPSPHTPAGGLRIHSSASVPIFKRQMQFFFCSILIAKMFNFQTFVFPEKCF